MTEKPETSGQSVGTRWPELIVAVVLMALAALVITDSLRVGIGWAEDGPRSGYFPFYIGVLLLLSSGSVLIGQLLRWRREDPEFAERAQIGLVISVLLPMLAYVGLITLLGVYLASLALIAYFMRRHGRYSWPFTGSVAVGVPLVFFVVFERWFLVPLPKGPIENLFGI